MGLDQTVADLRGIALQATDATGYFPALYARVTTEIARAAAGGTFEDGERMTAFATTFAGYYLTAFSDRAAAPACWRASWDVAGDERLLIVQHLLLGINAHVNHDLPLAVVDVNAARADFLAVNAVLASTYTVVLRDLDRVSRWTNEAARLGGGRLFNFSLRVARDQAWDASRRMLPLDAAGRTSYAAELDRLVTVLAYLVTQPAFPASLAVPLLRRFEQHDPVKVTRALLGPLA
ncbi:MAG TPA: DUF5995 family protein [Acidimicrobiales bacterium]|nr:DUF5995 family protein [Acidimicrobiales bacterium]